MAEVGAAVVVRMSAFAVGAVVPIRPVRPRRVEIAGRVVDVRLHLLRQHALDRVLLGRGIQVELEVPHEERFAVTGEDIVQSAGKVMAGADARTAGRWSGTSPAT